jgi:acyl carrier protein
VNFDLWRAPNRGAAASGFGRTVEELGHTADEAINAMETALAAKNASQLLVSTGDLNARLDQWIKLDSLKAPKRTGTVTRDLRTSPASRQPRHRDAPSDETEERVAQIWREVLGVEDVGINDNFAQLGGHSLFAIKIVHELRRAFQINLPVRVLFDAPTVSALSCHIKERLTADIEAMSEEEARRLAANE